MRLIKIILIVLIILCFISEISSQSKAKATWGNDGYAFQKQVGNTLYKVSHNSKPFIIENKIQINPERKKIAFGSVGIPIQNQARYIVLFRHSTDNVKVAVFYQLPGNKFFQMNYVINRKGIFRLKELDRYINREPTQEINELVIDEGYETRPNIEIKEWVPSRGRPLYKPPQVAEKSVEVQGTSSTPLQVIQEPKKTEPVKTKLSPWLIGVELGPVIVDPSNNNVNSSIGFYGAIIGNYYVLQPFIDLQLAIGYTQRGFKDDLGSTVKVKSDFFYASPRISFELPIKKLNIIPELKFGLTYTYLMSSQFTEGGVAYKFDKGYSKSSYALLFGGGLIYSLGVHEFEYCMLFNVNLNASSKKVSIKTFILLHQETMNSMLL